MFESKSGTMEEIIQSVFYLYAKLQFFYSGEVKEGMAWTSSSRSGTGNNTEYTRGNFFEASTWYIDLTV